jgi:cysteine desulfurase
MREGLSCQGDECLFHLIVKMEKIYFDHNATTPIHPIVADVYRQFLEKSLFGNPSSLHWAGRAVRASLTEARSLVAGLINARPEEIIFTSGGTEADNHALVGTAYGSAGNGNHIITSSVEHPAVLATCAYLEKRGFDVTYLKVDGKGLLDPDDVRKAIRKETILITIMHANNETGVILPIKEIGAIARQAGILFHSDMVQGLGKVGIDVENMNVDLASFSAHKIGGPKGVGCLFMKQGVHIDSILHGGHQEMGQRAGTEDIMAIAAFGKACEIKAATMTEEAKRIEFLRNRLLSGLRDRIEGIQLNGDLEKRLPNTLNMSFNSIEGESLLISLDLAGIAVSSGSACSSGSTEPSHVLLSMGIAPLLSQSAIRISLGAGNSEDEIDYALDIFPKVVRRLREMSPLYKP